MSIIRDYVGLGMGWSPSSDDEEGATFVLRRLGGFFVVRSGLYVPLRGSMMQIAAAPAAAVAASAAARVACDTAATICISDAPCGREAWDCRSGSTMLGKRTHG